MTDAQSHRLGELAQVLDLELNGDPGFAISGLAGLDDAGPADLSFVTGPRFAGALARSGAGAVIAPPDFDVGARPCLRSRSPYADFARAISHLFPGPEVRAQIHSTAVVAAGVELGDGVSVGAYTVIGEGARVGARTRIHPHVTIYPGVEIGEDCEIHSGAHLRSGVRVGARTLVQNGAVLGADGFGFTFTAEGRRVRIPHTAGVDVGEDAEIGANATVDASHVGQPRHGRETSATYLGPGVKVDNLVQVGHGVSVGAGTVLCAQVGLAGGAHIGRHVTMGGQSAAGSVEVGDGALVGGRGAAAQDVEPGAQVLGYPAMDRRLFGRVAAAWKRLPELLRRVKRIEQHLGLEDR